MSGFDVWRTGTLRFPFGLQRVESLAEFGLGVFGTFGGFYVLKETIEDIMKPAPLTLRPSVPIAEAIAYFEEAHLMFVLVTKSTGELMGGIRKGDLENMR